MSQEQPSSLPYWRSRQLQAGADQAIREAAQEIDAHVGELGRLRDLRVTVNAALMLVSFCIGFIAGHFLRAAS